MCPASLPQPNNLRGEVGASAEEATVGSDVGKRALIKRQIFTQHFFGKTPRYSIHYPVIVVSRYVEVSFCILLRRNRSEQMLGASRSTGANFADNIYSTHPTGDKRGKKKKKGEWGQDTCALSLSACVAYDRGRAKCVVVRRSPTHIYDCLPCLLLSFCPPSSSLGRRIGRTETSEPTLYTARRRKGRKGSSFPFLKGVPPPSVT